MSLRVNDTDVKRIIQTARDTTPFIEFAHAFLEEIVPPGKLGSPMLIQAEKWLAAHFVAIDDEREVSKSVGSGDVSYADKFDLGLDITKYGQQVKMMLQMMGINPGLRKAFVQVITPES